MQVIAIVNRKGGVSKTTTAAYLAMCLYQQGLKVIALDADQDASLTKWHATGALPYELRPALRDDLAQQITGLEADAVIIDTPPNDEAIIYKACGVADEVIVPIAATGLDVSRLFTTLKNVADVERMRAKNLTSVLLTRFSKGYSISQEVVNELERLKIPLLDSKIRNLARYQSYGTPSYLEEYEAVLKELGEISHA